MSVATVLTSLKLSSLGFAKTVEGELFKLGIKIESSNEALDISLSSAFNPLIFLKVVFVKIVVSSNIIPVKFIFSKIAFDRLAPLKSEFIILPSINLQ